MADLINYCVCQNQGKKYVLGHGSISKPISDSLTSLCAVSIFRHLQPLTPAVYHKTVIFWD